jgi:hypothetical protein
MCGQFGVPFWEFFFATLIGKAIIKTHIQVRHLTLYFYLSYLIIDNCVYCDLGVPFGLLVATLPLFWLCVHVQSFGEFSIASVVFLVFGKTVFY